MIPGDQLDICDIFGKYLQDPIYLYMQDGGVYIIETIYAKWNIFEGKVYGTHTDFRKIMSYFSLCSVSSGFSHLFFDNNL